MRCEAFGLMIKEHVRGGLTFSIFSVKKTRGICPIMAPKAQNRTMWQGTCSYQERRIS